MKIEEELIVKMIFGSHLYGLNTSNSDRDYKGIFKPFMDDLILNRAPKHYSFKTKKNDSEKNSSSDVDLELFSLHSFIDLAAHGETVAIDMLHAPWNALSYTSGTWMYLHHYRSKFYTKNLTSLIGYAKHQAAKYGVKGSRLHDAKAALEFLKEHSSERVGDLWDVLPITENLQKFTHEDGTPKIYEICGKKLTLTATCKNYIEMVSTFVERYGERAKLAEKSEGIDWKAVSHAFRAAYQVKHIFVDKGFSYPLPETDFLMKVKLGELHYGNVVGPMLDALLDEVMKLRDESTLPEKVDRSFFDDLIKNLYKYVEKE